MPQPYVGSVEVGQRSTDVARRDKMCNVATLWSASDRVSDGEPCPHCGEVPLDVSGDTAECPNCGSVFDAD